jgi:hypothetical protein
MSEFPVIEHGETRGGRWLRERRLKIALGLAVLEGLLVAVDVIPAWFAIALAIVVLALYFGWARTQPRLRDSAWVIAVWQAVVLLVPVLVIVVGTLALVAVAVLAVLALLALFADRR